MIDENITSAEDIACELSAVLEQRYPGCVCTTSEEILLTLGNSVQFRISVSRVTD